MATWLFFINLIQSFLIIGMIADMKHPQLFFKEGIHGFYEKILLVFKNLFIGNVKVSIFDFMVDI